MSPGPSVTLPGYSRTPPESGTAARSTLWQRYAYRPGGRSGAVLTSVTYGNRILPERPDLAVAAGRFHRMPILSGRTRDEGRFGVLFAPRLDEATFQQLLREAFGDRAPLVAAKYPSDAYGSPALAFAAVSTDRVYSCPHLTDEQRFARSHADLRL